MGGAGKDEGRQGGGKEEEVSSRKVRMFLSCRRWFSRAVSQPSSSVIDVSFRTSRQASFWQTPQNCKRRTASSPVSQQIKNLREECQRTVRPSEQVVHHHPLVSMARAPHPQQ